MEWRKKLRGKKIQVIADNAHVKFQSDCQKGVNKIEAARHEIKRTKSVYVYNKIPIFDHHSTSQDWR